MHSECSSMQPCIENGIRAKKIPPRVASRLSRIVDCCARERRSCGIDYTGCALVKFFGQQGADELTR
jgi:hypothetical protein